MVNVKSRRPFTIPAGIRRVLISLSSNLKHYPDPVLSVMYCLLKVGRSVSGLLESIILSKESTSGNL